MSATQLQVFNPPESRGPLRMEALKARDNGSGSGLTFMTSDDFKDAVEEHGRLRQIETAGHASLGDQLKDANARADRLQAILDAETGRKGLDGWVFHSSEGVHAWTFEKDEIGFATVHTKLSLNGSDVGAGVAIESNLTIVRDPSDWSCIHFQPTDALDGIEKATALLREYGVLPSLANST